VFEQLKTLRALDRAATGTGPKMTIWSEIKTRLAGIHKMIILDTHNLFWICQCVLMTSYV